MLLATIGYLYKTNIAFHTKYELNKDGSLLTDIKGEVFSFETAWNKRNDLLNQEIYVKAKIISLYGCTEMGCSLMTPCCNICTGKYYLVSESVNDSTEFKLPNENFVIEDPRDVPAKEKIGCYGDECSKICKPFLPDEIYIVKGIIKFDEYPKRVDRESGHYYFLYSGHKETTGKALFSF